MGGMEEQKKRYEGYIKRLCLMDDTFFKRKAEEIGDAFRLSPREREILGYIGRGHSSVYIAKTLVISENTVYTHVRNIYRKTGADSREELLEMFIPSR